MATLHWGKSMDYPWILCLGFICAWDLFVPGIVAETINSATILVSGFNDVIL